jgi:hypothetical protein
MRARLTRGKLTAAGVRTTSVRYNGIIHDFMMLNPLREAAASTGAVEQAIHILRKALRTDEPTRRENGPAARGANGHVQSQTQMPSHATSAN